MEACPAEHAAAADSGDFAAVAAEPQAVRRLKRPFLVTYDEARALMADHLEKYASAGGSPRDGYDEMDGALPRGGGPEWTKLFIALSFWDGWIDAWNHQWRYYEPIGEDDWPVLARDIARRLREDREIEDAVVLAKFAPKPRVSLVARIRQLFAGAD